MRPSTATLCANPVDAASGIAPRLSDVAASGVPMSLLSEPTMDAIIATRYGLSEIEAASVIAKYGHQADDHCASVARRLRDEMRQITGHRLYGNDIPTMVMAKEAAIRDLMFSARADIEHHVRPTPVAL